MTRLDLNAADPRQVHATIAVDRSTPVRLDTTVTIDFQGLTGSPVIALAGGNSQQPLTSTKGEAPLLVADAAAGQSMSQAAREDATPARRNPGRERPTAAQHDRQPRHLLGRARPQFRSS